MSLLIGTMAKRIEGHKDLTAHNEILTVDPDVVSIPLFHGGVAITPLVKEGDKVKVGDLLGVREDRFYVPIFSSVSGTVKAIEKKQTSSLKPADHVVIENDHKETKGEKKTLKADASKEEIVNYMKEIGLLGQGGAGFPAYFKYSTDKCETLIVNAVECEPYITADARNIETNLEYFKQGIKFAIKASNCSKIYVALKEYKKELIGTLKETLKDIPNLEVVACRDVYPMGWERTLIREVLKKDYDRLPIEVGAIVSNASTLIELAKSASEGYPIYKKIVTVAGDAVEKDANVICPVGTSFGDLIKACGGYEEENVVLLAGGPMMGSSITKDEVAVTSISNAVTVLKYVEYKPINCLRCGTCAESCPSGLQPVNIVTAYKAKDKDRLVKLQVNDCVECGMCSYVCPSKIEVTENVRRAKKLVQAK